MIQAAVPPPPISAPDVPGCTGVAGSSNAVTDVLLRDVDSAAAAAALSPSSVTYTSCKEEATMWDLMLKPML